PVKSFLNELTLSIQTFPLKPEQIASLIELVDSNKVSHSVAAKQIFPYLLENPSKTAQQVATEQNLVQESDAGALQGIIDQVLAANPQKVAEYKAGKASLLGMFMGDLMKQTKGKADPKLANK